MIINNFTVEHKKGSGYTTIKIFDDNGGLFKTVGFRQSQKDFDKSVWEFNDNFVRRANRVEFNSCFRYQAIPKAQEIIKQQFNIELSETNGDCDYDSRTDYRANRYNDAWSNFIVIEPTNILLAEIYDTKFYLKEDITEEEIRNKFEYFLR